MTLKLGTVIIPVTLELGTVIISVNYCNIYKIHTIIHVCEYCRE